MWLLWGAIVWLGMLTALLFPRPRRSWSWLLSGLLLGLLSVFGLISGWGLALALWAGLFLSAAFRGWGDRRLSPTAPRPHGAGAPHA